MTEFEKGRAAWYWLEESGLKGMTDDFKRGWWFEENYRLQVKDDQECQLFQEGA